MKKYLYSLLVFAIGGGILMSNTKQNKKFAIFAGGCFWCVEAAYENVPGVLEVISGYTGGAKDTVKYSNYASKGHVEAVRITYNSKSISYQKLLDIFWRNINPTDADGQFGDRGKQYRSIIFYQNKEQKKAAEESKQMLKESKRFDTPIVTEILPASDFYAAEESHQDYAEKNPIKYKIYRYASGRDAFLQKAWRKKEQKESNFNKPTDEQLRKTLTPLQYKVTQQDGTEPPYKNKYNDNYKPGIYVDIISGEPLFSSTDKYDSKTGWPSFTKPLELNNIVQRKQTGWFTSAIEVRSKQANSHLGHMFKDGPPPTGLRYCINSAALRFIPAEDLEKEAYEKYTKLF